MSECVLCGKKFTTKPRKIYCSYECCFKANSLWRVKEVFKLSEEDRKLRLVAIKLMNKSEA